MESAEESENLKESCSESFSFVSSRREDEEEAFEVSIPFA
jgi:hypothetical protein